MNRRAFGRAIAAAVLGLSLHGSGALDPLFRAPIPPPNSNYWIGMDVGRPGEDYSVLIGPVPSGQALSGKFFDRPARSSL